MIHHDLPVGQLHALMKAEAAVGRNVYAESQMFLLRDQPPVYLDSLNARRRIEC
jgi:hypothetical protein